jgi:hypothetical protein
MRFPSRRGVQNTGLLSALVFMIIVGGIVIIEGGSAIGTSKAPIVSNSAKCSVRPAALPLFGHLNQNVTSVGELVFSMPIASRATICVTYSSSIDTPALTIAPTVNVGTFSKSNYGSSFVLKPTSLVSIVPSNQRIQLSAGRSEQVEFTISSLSISSGYYFISLPLVCPALPLSVGHDQSQLTSADFPGMGPIPCPIQDISSSISSAIGVEAIYLSY